MNFSIIAASRLRANPFIIEVDTSKAGSANDAFQFTGAVGDYDVVAKQSGVVVQTFSNLSGQETITLSNGTGIYILEVTPKAIGGFNRIRFNNGGDKLKIKDVKKWGNISWSNFNGSFWSCENMLVTANDVPNLISITDMKRMFRGASLANPNTLNWEVSNVTDMDQMFFSASSANPNVSNWDVSNVTDMEFMFINASSANPNIRNWDVSNVTDMGRMLEGSNLSTANLDGCYINWSQLSLQSNVAFSAGTKQFTSAAQAGRDILVNTYNWTITDGGVV